MSRRRTERRMEETKEEGDQEYKDLMISLSVVDLGKVSKPNNVLRKRYFLDQLLGKGTFGSVWKAVDLYAQEKEISIKILKDKYREWGEVEELVVLRRLSEGEHRGKRHIVDFLGAFSRPGRAYIMMELLGVNMAEFLNTNYAQPFPAVQAVQISRQILLALEYLQDQGIMHCDIKPDNIVFVSGTYDLVENDLSKRLSRFSYDLIPPKRQFKKVLRSTDLKLVDFGLALFPDQFRVPTNWKLGTRPYRPPESILKFACTYTADMWSAGCTLIDVWIGLTLFHKVKTDLEHVTKMGEILGPMPIKMIFAAPKNIVYSLELLSSAEAGLRIWEKGAGGKGKSRYEDSDGSSTLLYNLFNQDDPYQREAFSLIYNLLQYVPQNRPLANKALEHELFKLQ